VPPTSEAISQSYVPPTSETPPSSKVWAVKGVGTKGWHSAESVLTTKATNVSTNTASATSKAAEVAAKATSGGSCRHRRWSERQAKRDRDC
jgi:hypothetical protein